VSTLLLVIVGLIAIRVPMSFALLIGAAVFALASGGMSLVVLPQTMFAGLESFILVAVPLFMLAGNVMGETSLTLRLTNFVGAWIGHVRGGLAQVAVMTNVAMSGMSGSATADAAATASLLVPAMRQNGYRAGFAAALISAAATVGPIIPPSIIMLVYASLASVSVSQLFLAGFLPGLTVAGFLMVYAYWHARRHGVPVRLAASWRERGRVSAAAAPALVMPLVVVGGIVGGVFTPTEASAVAVAYAVILGWGMRELKFGALFRVLRETAATTGVVMLMVASANVVSWLLIVHGAGPAVLSIFEPLADRPWLVLLAINVIFLVMGIVLEPIPLLMLLAPILLPLVKSLGVDLIHFGIILTLNTTIALVTPPVGASMFVTARIAGVSIEVFAREIMPFLGVLVLALIVVTYVPAISLFLPTLMR
jgi:tripartite ATP-independent transporter DctM subunit